MSVTDVAYAVLKNRRQPLHFKELIAEVMRIKAIGQENPGRMIAQMHTEINLDSRFVHLGGGEWGLREWQIKKQGKIVRIVDPNPRPAPVRRRRRLIDEEEELDEVEDLLDEDEEELLDEDVDELDVEDDDLDEEDEQETD